MDNTNLPYIFDFEPFISYPQPGAQSALMKCIQRWQYAHKPHIVADSAFGSLRVAQQISEWGGAYTFAVSERVLPHIWELLSRNTMLIACSSRPGLRKIEEKQGIYIL